MSLVTVSLTQRSADVQFI